MILYILDICLYFYCFYSLFVYFIRTSKIEMEEEHILIPNIVT